MEQEKWVSVTGYEGLYEVSNMGRVKSLEKEWVVGKKKETILKPSGKKGSYLHVVLSKDRVKRTLLVHRLVAKHYCDNFNNYDVVNHLDQISRIIIGKIYNGLPIQEMLFMDFNLGIEKHLLEKQMG